ncbi:hypothetical protein L3Q82_021084, partial [Scortum barcoo]
MSLGWPGNASGIPPEELEEVSGTYHQWFWAASTPPEETQMETYHWLRGLYHRWMQAEWKSKEQLGETIVLEQLLQFADDTAVVGRIALTTTSPTTGRRWKHLEGWCRQNNLCINVKKTKEMIVDFRRGRHLPSPLYIGGTAVEVVSSFRYLGVHISDDLTWSKNTSCLIRKAHQRLYFLRRLRRAGLGSSVLTSFYRCVVESVLSSCIIVWHGSCSAAEKKALQRVVEGCTEDCGTQSTHHHHGHLHLQMQETDTKGPCLSPSCLRGGGQTAGEGEEQDHQTEEQSPPVLKRHCTSERIEDDWLHSTH